LPVDDDVQKSVRLLKEGRLVAFPTETVYGLGADAENPDAIRRIFKVKGRPSSHPLIVHVAHRSWLPKLGSWVPPSAERLAEAFWPGPLTLVVSRGARVPLVVTGGQATVAIRVPNHPLALRLLEEFGGGVAAPSANRFGAVSPTSADHVRLDLGADVDHVLDGGSCEVGVESTIVDVSRDSVVLLRPGGISLEALESVLGTPVRVETESPVRTPGQLPSHYAPRARVVLAKARDLPAELAALRAEGARVGALIPLEIERPGADIELVVAGGAEAFARTLYASLRALDAERVDVILVVPPPAQGVGVAVTDRLLRAAAPRSPST
jgi:L-threonylcarbamoyladenylate synthase